MHTKSATKIQRFARSEAIQAIISRSWVMYEGGLGGNRAIAEANKIIGYIGMRIRPTTVAVIAQWWSGHSSFFSSMAARSVDALRVKAKFQPAP